MTPLISCIMPTRNRRAWLPIAIASFLAQSYENRELVIVNQGESVADIVPPDGRIRIELAPPTLNHGQMCNLACEHARGEIIAHWDDDDYSAPGRLVYQVAALQEANERTAGSSVVRGQTEVHSFHAMKFLDVVTGRWFQYAGSAPQVFGSALVYTRKYWLRNPFRPVPCGSDQYFSFDALRDQVLRTDPDCDLMYATAHSGNTSPRALNSGDFQPLPNFDSAAVFPHAAHLYPTRSTEPAALCAQS